jgi:hypothetical protein
VGFAEPGNVERAGIVVVVGLGGVAAELAGEAWDFAAADINAEVGAGVGAFSCFTLEPTGGATFGAAPVTIVLGVAGEAGLLVGAGGLTTFAGAHGCRMWKSAGAGNVSVEQLWGVEVEGFDWDVEGLGDLVVGATHLAEAFDVAAIDSSGFDDCFDVGRIHSGVGFDFVELDGGEPALVFGEAVAFHGCVSIFGFSFEVDTLDK